MPSARFLSSLLVATLAAAAHAQTDIGTFVGQPGTQAGAAVALAGAGPSGARARALAGAPAGTGPGTVAACALTAGGLRLNPWIVPLGGNGASYAFGAAIANVGDVSGDGHSDFLVGEPQATVNGQVNRGQAHVYDGKTGAVLWPLQGLAAGDMAGSHVAAAGDADGDGVTDFLVGAPGALRQRCTSQEGSGGQVLLFCGRTGALLASLAGSVACRSISTGFVVDWQDRLGRACAKLGKLAPMATGDAFLVATDANQRQRVEAFTYANGTLTAAWTVTDGRSTFGAAVAGLDDMDGDGVPDFAVGIPALALVELRSGLNGSLLAATSVTTNTLVGTALAGNFGIALANVGDVDGGGLADLLVGAPGADGDRGAAVLFSGESQSALALLLGDAAGDRFGTAVAGGEDMSGDGRPDVIIGAPMAQGGRGLARIYSFDPALPWVSYAGSGCDSSSPGSAPTIGLPNGGPFAGQAAFSLGVGNAYGASPAFVILGLPQNPPISGCVIGLCACDFLIQPATWLSARTTALNVRGAGGLGSGVSSLAVPLPNAPSLVGTQFSVQWIGVAPILMTPRLDLTIEASQRGC